MDHTQSVSLWLNIAVNTSLFFPSYFHLSQLVAKVNPAWFVVVSFYPYTFSFLKLNFLF